MPNQPEIKEGPSLVSPLTVEDFYCPLSLQIFLDPRQTEPCEHIFEKEELDKHLQTKQDCPLCRTVITKTGPPSRFFKGVFADVLRLNPHLQKERYFNEHTFLKLLSSDKKDEEEDRKLKEMANLLKFNENLLNAPLEDFSGISLVNFLVQCTKGRELILNFKLWEQFSIEALNKIVPSGIGEGTSAVTWFASTNSLYDLLLAPAFLEKINPQGLNAVGLEGIHKGVSAVSWLTARSSGRRALLDQPALLSKVTSQGLNAVEETDKCKGMSPVCWLSQYDEGIEILSLLADKVTVQGMTAVGKGIYEGQNAAYYLLKKHAGRKLLLAKPHLRAFLTKELLETAIVSQLSIVDSGPPKNRGLYWLMNTLTGGKILASDENLSRNLGLEQKDTRKRKATSDAENPKRLFSKSAKPEQEAPVVQGPFSPKPL